MMSSAVVTGSTSAVGGVRVGGVRGRVTRVEDVASWNGLAVRGLWLSM